MKRSNENTMIKENKRSKNGDHDGDRIKTRQRQVNLIELITMPSTYISNKIIKHLDTKSIAALGLCCKPLRTSTEFYLKLRQEHEIEVIESDTSQVKQKTMTQFGFGSPNTRNKFKDEPIYGWQLGQERFSTDWLYWRKFREMTMDSTRANKKKNSYAEWFMQLERVVKNSRPKQTISNLGAQSIKKTKHQSNDHEITWSNEKIILKELAKPEEEDVAHDLLGTDNQRFRITDCVVLNEWIIAKADERSTGETFPEVIMINKYGKKRLKFQSDNLEGLTKEAISNKSIIQRIGIQLDECERIGWSFERPPLPKMFGDKSKSKRKLHNGTEITIRTSFEQNLADRIITFNTSSRWTISSATPDAYPSMTHVRSRFNWTITRDRVDNVHIIE